MTVLHVRLLGGFELFFNEKPLTLKTQKAKGLFAYLILNRGVPLSRGQLAALLWPEQATEKASHSLRQALSSLRKAVPNFETFCHVERTQILCHASPELQVDVFRFKVAVEDGEETAVSLYQGPLLEGFYINDSTEYETWLLGQREQLQAQMLALLERFAQTAQQQMRWEDAKKHLHRLIDMDPWHELAYQALMRLLARQGEHNRAIALFKTLQKKLKAELDIEPMNSSMRLLEKIEAAREQQENQTLSSPLTHFVGRQREIEQIETFFHTEQARLVTIQGPGGVGKSSLALTVAHQLNSHFLNGAFFIPLAALSDPNLISREVATAVSFKAQHNQNFNQQLLNFLSNRELLLVLDNFEHLREGRQFVADILANTSDIAILITSREALNLQQEHRLVLEGLPYPTNEEGSQEETNFASYALFVSQAKKIHPNFDPASTKADILKICHLLQGMPLGIELAAAQLELQTVSETLSAISANFDSLEKEWGDRPDRHHSLRAIFQHAWYQLPQPLQKVLGQLSVFQGGFTLNAAQRVARASRKDLTQLLNKSLLQRAGQINTRFTLHPAVQQFAAEAIEPALLEQAKTEHAVTYLQLVKSFQDNEGYAVANLEQTTKHLGVELDNIRLAWKTAVMQQNITLLAPTLVGMSKFYAGQSWFQEGANLYDWTIAQFFPLFEQPRSEKELTFWGHLHGFAAGMFLYLSEAQTAQALAQRAINTLQPLIAIDELGYAWNMLGISLIYQGNFQEAIEALETSQQTYAKTDDRGQMLGPLINLGSVYQRVGRYEKGLASLMEAFAISEQFKDVRGSAHLLNNIGGILFSMGRLEEATEYFERCNVLCEETGYPMVQASALLNLAELQLKMNTGNTDKVIQYLDKGLLLSHKVGDKQKEARAHKLYADYWLQTEAYEKAHQSLKTGLTIVWPVKALPTVFELLLGFATYYLASGNQETTPEILAILATHASVPQHIQDIVNHITEENSFTLPAPPKLDELINKIS